MDLSVVAVIVQLIFLEGILSIDNAAVLGAMVSHLPDDVPIEWPPTLTRFGQRLHPALGNQRTAALRVGLLGAYLGRGLMLILASFIIQNPWLKLLGALYLLRLAFDNLGRAEPGEADAHTHPTEVKSFWAVVLTVELADLAFSLDNVVAAVGVSNNVGAVLLGVFIGILLMRFAAGWFSYLVEREPVLKTTAYILVLMIGLQLLASEFGGVKINDLLRFGLSIAVIVLSLVYAHVKWLHVFDPVLIWLAEGFANFNEVIDWALVPVIGLVKLPWRLYQLSRREPVPETADVLPDEPSSYLTPR
jgi:tellurite resistance protein TerC